MLLYDIIYDTVEVHGSEIQAVDAENKQLFIDVQFIWSFPGCLPTVFHLVFVDGRNPKQPPGMYKTL